MRLSNLPGNKGSRLLLQAAPLALLSIALRLPLNADTTSGSRSYAVIGREETYTVRRGDSLLGIARRLYTDPGTIARINRLHSTSLSAGKRLRAPSRHILPAQLRDGVVLNIPERAVYVFRNWNLLRRYPVAVGMKSWPTPTGTFDIASMIENPIWVTPEEMVRRERAAVAALPPQKKSPLGDRWMGWCEAEPSGSEVGFHGTHDVNSIGRLASHACVRLYPEHAREMFRQVYEGMPVLSVYEPIKVGKEGDTFFISVSPDVYSKGMVSRTQALRLLKAAGVRNPDLRLLKSILARQDGYPYPIAEDRTPPPQTPAEASSD